MKQLRDPHTGCPWDRKQTLQSLKRYTLEEVYEVFDAIDQGDWREVREELGDLLFQIVFYAQIAQEQNQFDFNDVVDSIVEKMIRRHPHVFADGVYADDGTHQKNWQAIKDEEKATRQPQGNPVSALADIPASFTVLMEAQKLQSRAAAVGFDWPDIDGVEEKLLEETAELRQALADNSNIAEEIGDVMFSLVNIARFKGLSAEVLMHEANQKFRRRFSYMEAHAPGLLKELSLEEMELLWQEAKIQEKQT